MMKRIILCEGKTDAILISYFLERKFGWSYIKWSRIKKNMKNWFQINQGNEVLNWYNHPKKPNQESHDPFRRKNLKTFVVILLMSYF